MQYKVIGELEYYTFTPSTFIFNIQAAATASQRIISETLITTPYLDYDLFVSAGGAARFIRVKVLEDVKFSIKYEAIVETTVEFLNDNSPDLSYNVASLGTDVIPYLFPSRYCQSDKLQNFAYKEFGKIKDRFERVYAIMEWINKSVDYLIGSTSSTTSAIDTISDRQGVCRDFAHLGVALCRASQIPARYFTAFAHQLNPQDFHACFEAHLGDRWVLFDATKQAPLNGMIKIANGRDAADASVASIFGNVATNKIFVSTEVLATGFQPFYYTPGNRTGISYS